MDVAVQLRDEARGRNCRMQPSSHATKLDNSLAQQTINALRHIQGFLLLFEPRCFFSIALVSSGQAGLLRRVRYGKPLPTSKHLPTLELFTLRCAVSLQLGADDKRQRLSLLARRSQDIPTSNRQSHDYPVPLRAAFQPSLCTETHKSLQYLAVSDIEQGDSLDRLGHYVYQG
ncbi:hypothetical protein BDW02DRAFT_200306 [Decorospora gaudefroyi]|uniref:Uncharacterized protein n=1 Tax=Decorospora gaudefroyi TaxID=184978 RepID=A0A6A5K2Z0_9PLEO|nr:hypothetical protein BDW02DRAFT_200306 [Decorospora gaudefroyi]